MSDSISQEDNRPQAGSAAEEPIPYRKQVFVVDILRRPREILGLFFEYLVRMLPMPPSWALVLHHLRGIHFKKRSSVYLRPLCRLASRHPSGLWIGENAFLDLGVTILTDRFDPKCRDHVYHPGRVRIEDDVFLGMNATILPDVTVGRGAYVEPGSVVVQDVPAYAQVRGCPAQVVGTLKAVPRAIRIPRARSLKKRPPTYREDGLSEELYPYEKGFFRSLVSNPGVILRSLIMHAIYVLPIGAPLVARIYDKMGVRFENYRHNHILPPNYFDHLNPEGISLGKRTHMSFGSRLLAHKFEPEEPGYFYRKAKLILQHDIFLGMNVILMPGITVEDLSFVGAGSTVFENLPRKMLFVGNPAVPVRETRHNNLDPFLTYEEGKVFYDAKGEGFRVFQYEHRFLPVLRKDPKRILFFLIEYISNAIFISTRQKVLLHRLRGVHFKDPRDVRIGNVVHLDRIHPEGISIGRNVTISDGASIITHYITFEETDGCFYRLGRVVVEDDAFLGANSLICSNVKIGQGAVLTPGSVVMRDVPPHTIVGGCPARVQGKREYSTEASDMGTGSGSPGCSS